MLKKYAENRYLQLFLQVALVFGLFMLFSPHLSADEFDAVNDILSGGDKAGKKALGTGVTWAFGVVLPFICIVAGAILGYSFQKKKSEQEQNTTKIYVVTAISAIVGFFVYAIVAMVISRALFGDANYIFQVINDFWKEAVR